MVLTASMRIGLTILCVAGPNAAYTYVALYGGTRTIAFVSTELYIGSISSSGYPNYDENAGNYHAFIKKVMLHEIGHTMDLTDQPFVAGAQCGGQVAGESVMNYQCGTNDVAGNVPSMVTACDNASVHYWWKHVSTSPAMNWGASRQV